MQLAFAICVALVVLNLYANQVLVRPITASYGIPGGATGWLQAPDSLAILGLNPLIRSGIQATSTSHSVAALR